MLRIAAILWLGLMMSPPLRAHEGHDLPGSLPPAPHGGVVKEADHLVEHGDDGDKPKLFFEAVYEKNRVSLYPLLLVNHASTFQAISPREVASMDVKVEYPRAKKTSKLVTKIGEKAFEAPLDVKGANRFILHLNVMHDKEKKAAKIQVEPK